MLLLQTCFAESFTEDNPISICVHAPGCMTFTATSPRALACADQLCLQLLALALLFVASLMCMLCTQPH